MPEEAVALRSLLSRARGDAPPPAGSSPVRAGTGFHQLFLSGPLGQVELHAVVAGIGKVASAAATQWLIDHFSPEAVLVVGIAGALHSDPGPGGLVVPTAAIQWDVDARPMASEPGRIPGQPATFESDAIVGGALVRACLEVTGQPARQGLALSGDRIVAHASLRDSLAGRYPEASCIDMETAAVAAVCWINGLPWAGVRSLSDSADEGLEITSILEFASTQASVTLAEVIRLAAEDLSH